MTTTSGAAAPFDTSDTITEPEVLSTGPLEVLGTLYAEQEPVPEGQEPPPPAPLPGWHVNAPWPITGWDAWRVTPKAPRRVFGGGITVHYTFADEAEFLQALATAYLGEPLPALADLKAQALHKVDQAHAATLLQLTGNPTQAEQTTWAGKVALAEAIQAGKPLTQSQLAFLTANGITEADRAGYAKVVITKSATYWTLVGLADKVRSDCKGRIYAASSHEELDQAMADNAAQVDQALAAIANR